MPSEASPQENAYFPGNAAVPSSPRYHAGGHLVTDAVGTIRFLNPAFAAMFKMDVKRRRPQHLEFFHNQPCSRSSQRHTRPPVHSNGWGRRLHLRYPCGDEGSWWGGSSRFIPGTSTNWTPFQHIRNCREGPPTTIEDRGLLRAVYTFDMIVGSTGPCSSYSSRARSSPGQAADLISGKALRQGAVPTPCIRQPPRRGGLRAGELRGHSRRAHRGGTLRL